MPSVYAGYSVIFKLVEAFVEAKHYFYYFAAPILQCYRTKYFSYACHTKLNSMTKCSSNHPKSAILNRLTVFQYSLVNMPTHTSPFQQAYKLYWSNGKSV